MASARRMQAQRSEESNDQSFRGSILLVLKLLLLLALLQTLISAERKSPYVYHLAAERCSGVLVAPLKLPLRIRTAALDLEQARFSAEVVTLTGAQIWSGTAYKRGDQIEVEILPGIRDSQEYLLRFYKNAGYGTNAGDRELLRETIIKVVSGSSLTALSNLLKLGSRGGYCPS